MLDAPPVRGQPSNFTDGNPGGHGWTIDDQVEIFELVPPESVLDPDQHQRLLYSSDLELGETTKRIFAAIAITLRAAVMHGRGAIGAG